MRIRNILMSSLAAILALTACQQKPYPIYFHVEEANKEGNSAKFIVMYNGRAYTRMPIINHEHIQSFRSFMNMQDGSYGVVFTLKKEMRIRLYSITQEKLGMLLLPVVNGLAFQPVRIDKPVKDGQLVIWGGLNGYDLKQIARTITPENPEIEEKRFKSKNPRPLPKLDADTKNKEKDYTGRTIGEIFSSAT